MIWWCHIDICLFAHKIYKIRSITFLKFDNVNFVLGGPSSVSFCCCIASWRTSFFSSAWGCDGELVLWGGEAGPAAGLEDPIGGGGDGEGGGVLRFLQIGDCDWTRGGGDTFLDAFFGEEEGECSFRLRVDGVGGSLTLRGNGETDLSFLRDTFLGLTGGGDGDALRGDWLDSGFLIGEGELIFFERLDFFVFVIGGGEGEALRSGEADASFNGFLAFSGGGESEGFIALRGDGESEACRLGDISLRAFQALAGVGEGDALALCGGGVGEALTFRGDGDRDGSAARRWLETAVDAGRAFRAAGEVEGDLARFLCLRDFRRFRFGEGLADLSFFSLRCCKLNKKKHQIPFIFVAFF